MLVQPLQVVSVKGEKAVPSKRDPVNIMPKEIQRDDSENLVGAEGERSSATRLTTLHVIIVA